MGSAQSGRRGGGSTAGDGKDGEKDSYLKGNVAKFTSLEEIKQFSEHPERESVKTLIVDVPKMGPKTSFEFKRCVASNGNVSAAVVRNLAGGPRLGYRDEIFVRVVRGLASIVEDTESIRTFDISFCEIGGSSPSPSTVSPEAASVLLESIIKGKERGIKFKHDPESTHAVNIEPWSLRRVVLSGNNLTHFGLHSLVIGALLRRLLSGPGYLHTLDLSGCNLDRRAVSSAMADGIVGIENLILSNNEIGGYYNPKIKMRENDTLVVRLLAKSLLSKELSASSPSPAPAPAPPQLPRLAAIDISNCGIGGECATILSEIISENQSLRSLKIAFNYRIENSGASQICSALQHNGTLRFLDLRGIGMRDGSALALSTALMLRGANQGELYIDISANDIGEECVAKVEATCSQLYAFENVSRVEYMASAAQRKVVMVRADSRNHIIARKRKFSAAQQHVATMALRSIEEGCIVEEIFPNAGAVGFRLMDLSAVGHVLKLEKTVAREVGSAAVCGTVRGTPARERRNVKLGSILTHVNGNRTAEHSFSETLSLLRSQQRPLRLRFRVPVKKRTPKAMVSAKQTPRYWARVYDPGSQSYYYFDVRTMETTWDKPDGVDFDDDNLSMTEGLIKLRAVEVIQRNFRRKLRTRQQQQHQQEEKGEEDEWIRTFDASTNSTYYYNSRTYEVAWERPV